MDEEQDEARAPFVQRFLEQHRPAVFGSARVDSGDNGEGNGDDNETEEPREADGELEVEAPEISGGHNVEGDGEDGVPAPVVLPPKNLFLAPRPRAKGVNHPPVPTRAQIDRHALEQHVNYAPWCPHCVQASALMKKHPLVTGESPSMPTVSADFCFMKSRDADPGDGVPVLVMRESQTRSLFSHACAGKSTSKEGYSSYLIGKCVEDIDSVQKDVHL